MTTARSKPKNQAKKKRPSRRSRAQIVEIEQKRATSFVLWLQGKQYTEIAKEVGYADASGAMRAVEGYRGDRLVEIEGNALHDAMIVLHLLRAQLLERALGGEHEAFNDLMRLMEREARMLGLDAPTRTSVGGDPELPPIQTGVTHLVITKEVAVEALKALGEAGLLRGGLQDAWVGEDVPPEDAGPLALADGDQQSSNGTGG